MKHSQQLTLMDSLKSAVSDQHARMEALPFIAALTEGKLPLESYVGLLRAMAVIHGTLEHELGQLQPSSISSVMLDRPSRLFHLRKDLSIFDKDMIPDIEAAVNETRKTVERIRLYRVSQDYALLGILYVLEGTTLGNSVHLADVLHNFGDKTSGKAYYYKGYGKNTGKYWKAFREAMNDLDLDQAGREKIIEAALEFFTQLENLFTTLYPVENAEMIFTAGILNPEAGNHSVPDDGEEIKAAILAAKRCREEFPYFDERYQERGRSFAKSDAAWLASLALLPETQLLVQVEWLGRVLSDRGMPRITLERQLELLHEELVAAVPEKADGYSSLAEAAKKLKQERLSCIPDSVFSEVAKEFGSATDNELQGRFKRTSDLVLSAVCDKSAGISDAVMSLQPWLTDEERFPKQWIAAVDTAFKTAEESVNR